MTENATERFWAKVDMTGGEDACWPWLASRDSLGYGYVNFNGKTSKSHRVAFELSNGVKAKDCVLHRCDNPSCCNPAHLWQGTQADNMRDKCRKGRHVSGMAVHPERAARGEKNGRSRLNEDSVRSILMDSSRGDLGPALAKKHRVSKATIYRIVSRKCWKHVVFP